MLPSLSGILAEAINTKILTKNRPDSPHSHPDSSHSNPDSPFTHPHSPQSHSDSPHSYPDSPHSPHAPHSHLDSPHSHLDFPRSHPDSPRFQPDFPSFSSFYSPIPHSAFIDSLHFACHASSFSWSVAPTSLATVVETSSNEFLFGIFYEIKHFLSKYQREHIYVTSHFCKDISVKKSSLDANVYYLTVREWLHEVSWLVCSSVRYSASL